MREAMNRGEMRASMCNEKSPMSVRIKIELEVALAAHVILVM